METTRKNHLADNIITGLRKAATELEEFRLQAALGKAEAKDVYERVKKTFNQYIHEAKLRFAETKGITAGKSIQLKTLLEELQVQLALGKADSMDHFEEQHKKITKTLNELETLIRKNKIADEYYNKFQLETEKFKIKLNILKLRYNLNKLDASNKFEEKKTDFSRKLSDIKKRILNKETEAEGKWENFQDEISDAYLHLKKAFMK